MALDVWTQSSGTSLGTFTEQTSVNIALPAAGSGITYTVISGALPGGLSLSGSQIIGYPYVVVVDTKFTFCIRASNGNRIADRTFSITVHSDNIPTFVTAAGALPVGIHQQLYALDRTYVNYKVEAFDLDQSIGTKLTYYIASGDGKLPPGLSMDANGRITGYILPTFKITPKDGKGTYDEATYDAVAYDFAILPTNGFDTYFYDDVFYDYNLPDGQPISLNVNYQFKVTVTDGYKIAQRIFRIFVVGDDTFRADNTALDGFVGDQGFTADATYLRQPVWLSDSNLGLFRASNYLTVPVALYDNTDVYYRQELTNQEVRVTSINVTNIDNSIHSNQLTVTNVKGTIVPGQYICFENIITGASAYTYRVSNVVSLGNNVYRVYILTPLEQDIPPGTVFYIGSLSKLPPGLSFDLQTAQLYGNVPYQPAITTNYNFTLTATRPGNKGDTLSASKTFTITIVGEIDSVITWNTPVNLGSINANYISTLRVSATTTIMDAVVLYTLVDGSLPNGLSLSSDGEIIGKVIQFPDVANDILGLTSFDGGLLTFDAKNTTVDRVFSFTVDARDQFGYSATTRTFSVTVNVPDAIAYSNIRVQPYLNNVQRTAFKSFMNNTLVFSPESIYRSNDPNFGLQYNLAMIAYAGIQTNNAGKIAAAMGLNHKRKRFIFNSVETAVAYLPGTNTAIYEVVYLKMLDPLEPNGSHLPLTVKSTGYQSDTITIDSVPSIWSRKLSSLSTDGYPLDDLSSPAPANSRPLETVTADSTGYQISNPNVKTFFPNSITNWQYRIGQTGLTERNYLPLWMRSIQPGTKQEIGFVLAVPICYCLVGKSAGIKLLIENSGFDFKQLDYTVDRYIIDSVTGYTSDKYLVFKNDRITV
jgi:hypothetical protein